MPQVPAPEPGDELMFRYEQVAADIRRRVRSGELAPGARLPGEQDLAEEHGVALGTARKAVRMLRDEGLLVTRASLGTFVVRELPPEA
jgi:GntR family transcriptional regulator